MVGRGQMGWEMTRELIDGWSDTRLHLLFGEVPTGMASPSLLRLCALRGHSASCSQSPGVNGVRRWDSISFRLEKTSGMAELGSPHRPR